MSLIVSGQAARTTVAQAPCPLPSSAVLERFSLAATLTERRYNPILSQLGCPDGDFGLLVPA